MFIAWFLCVIVSWQEWPVLLGPYEKSECLAVKEYLDRRGYEVGSCGLMPLPQEDARYEQVPFIP